MKKLKKIMALALAMVMILAMSITVFAEVPDHQTIADDNAADATTGKYTISVATDDTHSYTVYQILTGTLIAGESKLGNPVWGADAKEETGTSTGVDDFIKSITASGLSKVEIDKLVEAQLASEANGQGIVTSSESLDVVPGYYLIVDTTGNVSGGDAYSLNIVAVFNDIKISPKKGTTESQKKVDDQNDSNSKDASQLKDSADYDIGDDIPYTLTFKLPADYANYESYAVDFYDDMSAGLTYNDDAKIYYGASDTKGANIAFTADAKTSEYSDGTVYKASVANLKSTAPSLAAGDVITIKYTAKLNSGAVIGSTGNPNKYQVAYSNNPNAGGEGTKGTTPWDKNIVFTYEAVFNKVDPDNKPLTGADFTLYKFVEKADGTDTYGEGDLAKRGTWTDVTVLNSDTHPMKETSDSGQGDSVVKDSVFTFSGLDAGVYKLSETTTPAGYNTMTDKIFTISAEHDLNADDPALTKLEAIGGLKITGENTTGKLETNIQNNQGSVLPSTGGIGTTIFYVLGAILVIGAGLVLVTKKRMGAEK